MRSDGRHAVSTLDVLESCAWVSYGVAVEVSEYAVERFDALVWTWWRNSLCLRKW